MTLKVSIWHQFSSNHSASFDVVGEFKDAASAEAAYQELRSLLFEVDRWHRENPEQSAQGLNSDMGPVPIEEEIAARYGVEWPVHIDWPGWALYRFKDSPKPEFQRIAELGVQKAVEEIDKVLTLIDNLIVIEDPGETWMGVEPFQGLLGKMGASPIFALDMAMMDVPEVEIPPWKTWRIQIGCKAPDEPTADMLFDRIGPYLADDRFVWDKPSPPWGDVDANFARAMQGPSLLSRTQLEILAKQLEKRFGKTPEDARAKAVGQTVAIGLGSITRSGTSLVIGLPLVNGLTVAAVITWLESVGCTDLKLTLTVAKEDGA